MASWDCDAIATGPNVYPREARGSEVVQQYICCWQSRFLCFGEAKGCATVSLDAEVMLMPHRKDDHPARLGLSFLRTAVDVDEMTSLASSSHVLQLFISSVAHCLEV
jgi:hypothetical protein